MHAACKNIPVIEYYWFDFFIQFIVFFVILYYYSQLTCICLLSQMDGIKGTNCVGKGNLSPFVPNAHTLRFACTKASFSRRLLYVVVCC